MIRLTVFTVIFGFVASIQAEEESLWRQWRGPSRTGFVAKDAAWPDSLQDDSLTVNWSIELQPSYSTPIVTPDYVIVTETVDKKSERVIAFDRSSGEQIWDADWDGAITVPFFAAKNGSWIRATPIADNESIYVPGIRDVLVSLQLQTGEIEWTVDFVKEFGSSLPSFGFVSSPLIEGDFLYVQAGGGLVKVEKSTGKVVWRVLNDGGGMGGSAFSSPVIETIDGVKQLVVQTRSQLAGVDLDSGDVLWKHEIEAFRGMNILTPTVYNDQIFTSSYGGGSVLINASNDQGSWNSSQTWRNKLQGYMSSPIIIDGHAYLHQRNQRFACINLETGKEAWITTPFGEYWSMVSNGDSILALDSRGELLLIDPSPEEFRLVDRRKVSESPTWAHLVVVDDELYVRALDRLTVYNWKHE